MKVLQENLDHEKEVVRRQMSKRKDSLHLGPFNSKSVLLQQRVEKLK